MSDPVSRLIQREERRALQRRKSRVLSCLCCEARDSREVLALEAEGREAERVEIHD